MQYAISAADLEVVLALVRCRNLANASERLGVDTSTVFRNLQRIERGLGMRLFERSRTGYLPLEMAQSLAGSAEQIEWAIESARSVVQQRPERVSGTVKITTTDTLLHGLVAPQLKGLRELHPLLDYDMHTGNELLSLTRRDADIAVRATKQPPQHLIGKCVGSIRVALFAARLSPFKSAVDLADKEVAWIAPDEALPEHPTVLWRKRHYPKAMPTYRVDSILSVLEFVALGLGVGLLPLFLTRGRDDLLQLTDAIDDGQTDLWLLTHPQSRHLRRVASVFGHLSQTLSLD